MNFEVLGQLQLELFVLYVRCLVQIELPQDSSHFIFQDSKFGDQRPYEHFVIELAKAFGVQQLELFQEVLFIDVDLAPGAG